MSTRPDCRKFSPNIFNKTKCTNCFKQKEEHTAEALESNRAARKVAKCGYLFVAPGWDFTNPLNRTKRWQRRWFVLYDDGEFSYALDEHPETVPQASIDMNKVVEVANAEEVTGNAFSLAITAPDHVHFVKGTCREEIRFWSDVLSVFPRSKGRHKRNATFPGSTQTSSPGLITQTPIRGVVSCKGVEAVRNEYNCRLSSGAVATAAVVVGSPVSPLWEGDDVFPTRDTTPTHISSGSSIDSDSHQRKVYMGSPPTRDKVDSAEKSAGGGGGGGGGGRLRRSAGGAAVPVTGTGGGGTGVGSKRSIKGSAGRSYTEDLSNMLSSCWQDQPPHSQQGQREVNRRLLLEEYENECKLKDIADCLTRPRNVSPHDPTDPHKQIRGDPDGCGLDVSLRYSPSDLRVELPSEDLLNIKKGWLMKQGLEKEWSKHWFVLRGNALLYYRDPSAEDQGILDGVIDLSGITSVTDLQVQRNYGFQITTWDERRYVLSAVTSGIRANWTSAMRKAAGLSGESVAVSVGGAVVQQGGSSGEVVMSSGVGGGGGAAVPRLLLLSSDDEYRTASESGGGRRESGEWGEALPPSPPLNRTPMSRVKERARGVSKLRVYGGSGGGKRSRSSPPSSRRSTLDSISSTDLIPTSLPTATSSPQDNKVVPEIDEVKHELSYRLRELSSTQEELMRQRQRNADIQHLEKLVEDLSKRAEETGKQRARESAELECLKKRFVEEKVVWEASAREVESELEVSATRCASLRAELGSARETSKTLADRLAELEGRLEAASRENESLYTRLSALDSKQRVGSPQPPTRSRSLDSLSDLTNIDLDIDRIHHLDKDRLIEEYSDMRLRFEKAVSEIRAMKRELREAHAQADWLELGLVSVRQEMKSREDTAAASNNLMAARIQDLATKLVQSEKHIRTLKQKLSKTETKEKRRSLSLKGRESFAISKEFEEKLRDLECRVNTLDGSKPDPTTGARTREEKTAAADTALSVRLRRKSLDSATSSEPMKVLLRLNSLEAKIGRGGGGGGVMGPGPGPAETQQVSKQATELKLFSGDEMDTRQSEIIDQVKKMENLLRAKLVVLAKKRESLVKSGQWNEEARLNLLAEKLAYESVLVGRLHEAITESYSSRTDTREAERLMQGLDRKLAAATGSGSSSVSCRGAETSLDYLVKHLAKHLSQQEVKRVTRKSKQEKRKRDPVISDLINKKAIIDAKVVNYLNDTLGELARSLARECLHVDDRSEEERTSAAQSSAVRSGYEQTMWNLARETVDSELIQEEVVRVMSQCTEQYERVIEEEVGSRFLCLVRDRAELECWADQATRSLRANMDSVLSRLRHHYTTEVSLLKGGGAREQQRVPSDEVKTREMLARLADIVAHKSLLDARIAVVPQQGDEPATAVSLPDSASSDQEASLEEQSLLSEIQYLYVKFCSSLTHQSKDRERVDELVDRLSEEMAQLERALGSSPVSSPRCGVGCQTAAGDSVDLWLDSVQARFLDLRERLASMMRQATSTSSSSHSDCRDCDKCQQMHSEISRIEGEYSVRIQSIERRQEEEMSLLKTEFEQQRQYLIRQHRDEEEILLKSNSLLEKQLKSLSYCTAGYSSDSVLRPPPSSSPVDTAPTLYSVVPSTPSDSLHLRYQKEIQHLRAVCEKGLIGMENSHRRQIEELEEKHERELESLRVEKEQALAEETHATLAALDAMRKAHEAEVQKEIAKFKTEFLSKMQTTNDFNAIHKQHQAEMAEIKTEILSLSEKYSVKCVENASLEDKLRSANQQLAMAHQRIIHLDSRYKQLRAQLGGETDSPSPPVARLHQPSHGEVFARRPRVVDFIPKPVSGGGGRKTDTESRLGGSTPAEPPPLGKPEVRRCPEFSLCGMVSKRRQEFERLLAAPSTCQRTSRV